MNAIQGYHVIWDKKRGKYTLYTKTKYVFISKRERCNDPDNKHYVKVGDIVYIKNTSSMKEGVKQSPVLVTRIFTRNVEELEKKLLEKYGVVGYVRNKLVNFKHKKEVFEEYVRLMNNKKKKEEELL